MDHLQKRIIALRYWLTAKEYHSALKMMDFAASCHTGKRKDNVTPEFSHQIMIAMYMKTLEKYLLYPEDTFIAVLGHDLIEDHNINLIKIRDKFGEKAADAIWLLTKKTIDITKTNESYFLAISEDPIASIVKGADRIHNQQSMFNTFTIEKQKSYINETEIYILPTIKKAKRLFPEQEPVYENIKLMLISQIELLQYAINSSKTHP